MSLKLVAAKLVFSLKHTMGKKYCVQLSERKNKAEQTLEQNMEDRL